MQAVLKLNDYRSFNACLLIPCHQNDVIGRDYGGPSIRRTNPRHSQAHPWRKSTAMPWNQL
ncbi:hypothetical protein BS47DRAFT_1348640, partial [Hydnum rufescens UP504]